MGYDVIVVGAGPAGSTTARECAARGLSTLLVDKAEFPRDKPCGGGVTIRAARQLPFDLAPVIERTIRGVRFSLRQSRPFTRRGEVPLVYMTQRRHLDQYLLERAVAAGVTLRERAPVEAVAREGRRIAVRAGGESFEALALVAADGANGRTAALVGIPSPRWMGVALEANIAPSAGITARWEDVFALDLGALPGGYGWVFPKGDHVNVGVGGWTHTGPLLRATLDRVTRHYGLDPRDYQNLRGHRLPMRRPGAPLADGNVVLVGDAAGLLDPFTYEGIYAAIWSGRTAAEHLHAYLGGTAVDLAGYERQVASELLPDLQIAGRIADLFELTPRFYLQLAKLRPLGFRAMSRLALGEQTYAGMNRSLGPLSVGCDLTVDLLRTMPALQRCVDLADPRPPTRFFRAAVQ